MKITLKELRAKIAERLNDAGAPAYKLSDRLEHILKIAGVFANIQDRRIRLDVMRMATGEYDKIDPENIRKALGVLGELDEELYDAFEAYIQHTESGALASP